MSLELKYKSLKDFKIDNPKEYRFLVENHLLHRLCYDMCWKTKTATGYWQIKERCISEALKYKTKSEWSTENQSSYNTAKKNGWFDECTLHMPSNYKESGYWNIKENVLEEVKKYKSKTEWFNGSQASKKAAFRNGWVEECTAHMIKKNKPKSYWTKERCMEDALKYASRNEWQKTPKTGYQIAFRNGWVEECTKHMK